MDSDVRIKKEKDSFKYRVAGVIIKDNKILIDDVKDSECLYLPGGYVHLGENSIDAVKRELEEELKREVIIQKYLGIAENFFEYSCNLKMHELSVYYLVDFKDESIETKDYSLVEDDNGFIIHHNFRWIDIDKIDDYDIRPAFLIKLLKEKNIEFNHIIFNNINGD